MLRKFQFSVFQLLLATLCVGVGSAVLVFLFEPSPLCVASHYHGFTSECDYILVRDEAGETRFVAFFEPLDREHKSSRSEFGSPKWLRIANGKVFVNDSNVQHRGDTIQLAVGDQDELFALDSLQSDVLRIDHIELKLRYERTLAAILKEVSRDFLIGYNKVTQEKQALEKNSN